MQARGTAFASDFDGTLCVSDWELGTEEYDPRDLEAVRRYQRAGGLFGICTGRPLFSVLASLAGKVDLDFYVVMTGAQVLGRDLVPVFESSVPHDAAREVFERYGSDDVSVLVVTDDAFFCVGREAMPLARTVPSIEAIEGRILGVSLEYHGDERAAAAAAKDLAERYGSTLGAFQNLGSVDIVSRGCSKGEGVRIAKEALRVDTIAGIGDSYNDLPLLAAADVSYTFHGAPDEVRRAADRLVPSVAEALADLCA